MIINRAEYNDRRDDLSHPPIPDAEKFFDGYEYEIPECVFGWEWSYTFNRWSALVKFPDIEDFQNGVRVWIKGWKGWTYPKPS
jgi:hypothetical protein